MGAAVDPKPRGVHQELLLRGCEAALLSAVVCAQTAGVDDLADVLARLHTKAGNLRRDVEEGRPVGAGRVCSKGA